VARVCVNQLFDASVHEVETRWYDVSRWPEWVDGLARVISVDGGWPQVGSEVIWQSSPAGRGRVSEQVEAYEPLRGLTVRVHDEAIEGHQRVRFEPAGSGVEVELSLDYRIMRRTPVTPLIERLFVRRPMIMSLTRTLERFGSVLG
jgi:Polyketide cyclase / dehydrase and lipid transport